MVMRVEGFIVISDDCFVKWDIESAEEDAD
jgi:hypothetical protein